MKLQDLDNDKRLQIILNILWMGSTALAIVLAIMKWG